ncbi:MAG: hypothetical protein ACK55Z_01860 [bacterium]
MAENTLYPLTKVVYNSLGAPFPLSSGPLVKQPVRCGPDPVWPLILSTY